MLAVHLEKGRVEVRDVPKPERPAGHSLIRLICAGICNTDLELQRGYYEFAGTPGHEFVGEVVESDDRNLVGKRVVGEINLACGHCDWCRRSMGRHCPTRTVLGIIRHPGAFQEFLTLPDVNLHTLPDAIPDERAVFAEPVAAACEILDQVTIPPDTPVAVLGDGKLGLLIALVLNAHGYPIRQFGHHNEKLAIASSAGVKTQIAPECPEAAAFDWVVEATGSPDGLRQAVSMVRPQGTVIMKSTVHGTVPLDTAPVIVNEITLIGSRCGRFEPALQLLEKGLIPVEKLIAARMPLREAPAAFARAAEPGTLKVLLS